LVYYFTLGYSVQLPSHPGEYPMPYGDMSDGAKRDDVYDGRDGIGCSADYWHDPGYTIEDLERGTFKEQLLIIPQAWVEEPEPPDRAWMLEHAPALMEKYPQVFDYMYDVAVHVGVSWKLLITRAEAEQSAASYAWDGSTWHYGGGRQGDLWKLYYFCGVDKTDSGPRPGGWFNPKMQMLGCALRFKYWYRGIYPANRRWRNWLGLEEDARYQAGVPVTRKGITIVPVNQASADCLRYTTSMTAQYNLAEVGRRWFPEDYREEQVA
jgi:hypothetical protein